MKGLIGTGEVQDMQCKHDGRVVIVTVYVNTNEDREALFRRCIRAARGPNQNAAVATLAEHTGDDGRAIWTELQQVSAQVAASPRAETWRP